MSREMDSRLTMVTQPLRVVYTFRKNADGYSSTCPRARKTQQRVRGRKREWYSGIFPTHRRHAQSSAFPFPNLNCENHG